MTGRRASTTPTGASTPGSVVAVLGLAVVCGIVSPARPTASTAPDLLWNTAFALVTIAAATRARRVPVVWLLGVSALVGVGGSPTGIACGVGALALGIVIAAMPSTNGRFALALRAIGGALAVVALTHGPSFGTVWSPVLVATAAVVPVFVSGWRTLGARRRRSVNLALITVLAFVVVATATAAVAAVLIRSPLSVAESRSRSALQELADGETAGAGEGFADAATKFDEVHSIAAGPLGWTGRVVPVVAQHLTALRDVSAAGADLAATAERAASSADWRTLTASGGRVNLQAIDAMRAPAAAAAAATTAAHHVIDTVRSPWLVGPVSSRLDALSREVGRAEEQARVAAAGLEVAPGLLGAHGPRRYLLSLATPGESRNGGGYVGSFGVMTAIDGELSFDSSRSTRDLASPGSRAGDLVLPPDWETRYGSMHVGLFPGNLSASPSWPEDAAVAGQIAALNPAVGPVDGVVYADPLALAALLDLTGPVRVPSLGRDLDSTTVVTYLFVDQYVRFRADNAQRLDALSDVTSAVFEALVDRPLPGLSRLGSVLGPVVAGGHLRLATLGSPAEEAFLDDIGLSGRWTTRPGADYVSLRSANMLPSKIDVFMTRDIEVTIDYDPASGSVRSKVRATITNSAPARGLPPYVIGTGELAPIGTNRNLLSLYSPLDIRTVTVDGKPAGAQVQSEFGGNVFSVPITIPSGRSVVVTWELQGSIDSGPEYRLDVLPPALSVADRMRITVIGADPDVIMDGALEATERFDVPVVSP